MAKGSRSRLELRRQHEAAEAREEQSKKQGDDEDLGDLDGGGDDAAPEATAAAVATPTTGKKKAPAKKKAAGETKTRKKVAKVVRKRYVWVVLDNSSKKVAQFEYTQKAEAEAYAEKMKAEKKMTYFVQPLKEEIPS